MKILVIHGPNLNMLGSREPGIYGTAGLDDLNALILERVKSLGGTADFFQSNCEGSLISKIHDGELYDGVILNPAGYGHTSIALHDAIKAIATPVIEVHLSNIHAREEFRHHTYTSSAVRGVICGFGAESYLLAADALASIILKGRS